MAELRAASVTVAAAEIGVPGRPPPTSAGPFTRSRVRRSATVYGALLLVEVLLQLLASSIPLQIAGVGLWFPGAGFLAVGGWTSALTALTLVLFVLSLIAWFGTGGTSFPVLVWAGSAVIAAALHHRDESTTGVAIAAVLLALFVAAQVVHGRRTRAKALARRSKRLAVLPDGLARLRERAVGAPAREELELSARDLGFVRYCLDRALQPVGQFDGYVRIDQFQTAALRYQINFLGYALAVMQAHYTPNFHGYGTQAQRNLIETYRVPKVWGYWRLENAWGNLSLDGDPAKKDNIMLTGYYGLQVALYSGLTGDERYLQSGSLTFSRGANASYEHDLHTIVKSLVDNFRRAPMCLYPCEPNWVYTACNFRGLTALQAYDRACGTDHATEFMDIFRERLEQEFTGADLSIIALRSQLTGLAIQFPLPDGTLATFLSSLYPDLAERSWAFVRQEAFEQKDGRLQAIVPKTAVDVTWYRPGYGQAMETLLGGAREMGDLEAAQAAVERLDDLCEPLVENGVESYRRAGTAINVCVALDRMLHRDFWRRTVLDRVPESTLTGPVLADVAYPDVLVARAISAGADLDLILQPGGGGSGQQLGLARLQPGRGYDVSCENGRLTRTSLRADAIGTAILEIELTERTRVRVVPA